MGLRVGIDRFTTVVVDRCEDFLDVAAHVHAMRGAEELHIVQTCSGRNISLRCRNEASLTGFDLVDERTSSGAVRDIFSRCFPVDLCRHAAAALEIATERLITSSEEHTSELQSLMRNSYAAFCMKKK